MSPSPIKRILVAVDLSACSRAALEFARRVAEPLGASLEALYVLSPDHGAGHELELAAAREELHRFVHSVVGATPVVEHVEPGEPRERIVAVSDRGGFDAIVMGTEGRTGRARAFAGSVAESVVRTASVPVMTVREKRH
ncbi:MAG TPA: universal stress protein [Polyangiaceae bacterium]|nr:universal stress protein [Polyangiaceae bacterium]